MQQPNNDKKPGLSWSTPSSANSANTAAPKQQAPSVPLTLPKMSPNNANPAARYVGTFVGGLIVGIILAWGWWAVAHKDNTAVTANGTATVNKTETSAATTKGSASAASDIVLEGGELTVASPQTAGQSVHIDNATVSKPTWVVVYDDLNGKPGNILGAQLFFTSGSGIVTLLRPTMAGKTYLVGRSIDDGDRKFQKGSDQPVADANGNPIVTSFTAN